MNNNIIIIPIIIIYFVIIIVIYYIENILYPIPKIKSKKQILKNKNKLKNFFELININNNPTLFIIPHLELGDNLIINGMIRYYLENNNVILVCKQNYLEQLNEMYKDVLDVNNKCILKLYPIKGGTIENLNIFNEVPIDKEIIYYFNNNNIKLLIFNNHKPNYNQYPHIIPQTYPTFFYTNFNLNPNIQYTKFKINRDLEKEDNLYQKLINIIGNNYIVIIDDEKRKLLINNKYINSNLPIFKIGLNSNNTIKELNNIKDKNIFNYIKILENATEIHSIDSSILLLIDMLPIKGNIYVHSYVRNNIFYNVIYKNKYIKYIY